MDQEAISRIIKDTPNPLLDEGAAAAYLGGLSTKTLQAWRVRGVGPVFRKIGRLCRYLQSDLDAYIQAQARHSTSEA